jgi:hypothetical protein
MAMAKSFSDRPARGIDARLAVQRATQSRCRRQGPAGRGRRRRDGLEFGVGLEGRAGFFRLGQVEVAGGDHLEPVGRQQILDLAHLALIVAGDDQRPGSRGGGGSLALDMGSSGNRHFLKVDKLPDPLLGKGHQLAEFVFGERRAFRRALDLDDAAGAGHDEIGVGFGVESSR